MSRKISGWVTLVLILSFPILILATCTYTAYSPHLLANPINSALYKAPIVGWRSDTVALIPDQFGLGESEATVWSKLEEAGFEIWADYSTDTPPRDPHPDDDYPQEAIDKSFARTKKEYNAMGITHIFSRGGRTRPACGERFFIRIGIEAGKLINASGDAQWTCL